MRDLSSINQYVAGAVARPERRAAERAEQRAARAEQQVADSQAEAADRVEISAAAANYDPKIEAEKAMDRRIATIRAQIADGTYLTDEKLDAVVNGLHEELFGK